MAYDILLDEDGDLLIVNGDFVIGESIDQEVGLILQSNKGEYKEFPTFGLNLIELTRIIHQKSKNLNVKCYI